MLNRLFKNAAVFLLFSICPVFFISAEEEDVIVFETEEIIIEDAVVEEDSIIRTGQVTVFDREAIEASGARTVADLIKRSPGIVISKQGGILEPQSVSIRGGAADHVLIIVNGKAADSLWTGSADPGGISVSNIERIEVIRGAASAIYGEGAVSGVINIIYSEEPPEKAAAQLEYGIASFNTHKLNGRLGGPIGSGTGLSGELAAGGLYTAGSYEYQQTGEVLSRSNNDGWAAEASAVIKHKSSEEETPMDIVVSGSFASSERGTPGLMEFLTPEARSNNLRAGGGVDLTVDTQTSGGFGAEASYSYNLSRYANPEAGIDDVNNNSSVSASAGWEIDWAAGDAVFDLSADAAYSFNYLYSTALTDSTGSAVDGNAVQHSANINLILNVIFNQFDLTPAAGLQWILNNYTALTPAADLVFSWSLAAGYSPFRNEYEEGPLYIKVNAGTAYKNPSFQDLFWPSGALASGNPDLLPETSLNIDAGLAVEIPAFNEGISDGGVSLKTEAVGFFSTVDNLIQWIPTSGGIWRPLNVGYVYNAGLELSAAASYAEESGKYSIEASLVYNWLKSIDADNTSVNYGRQLAYKPEHSANLSLLFRIPDILSVELNGNYLGYRFSNNANTKYIDQALLLSAAVNYTVTEIFDVSASTDNILNLKYIDRLGYPVPGIEWSLQGRIKI